MGRVISYMNCHITRRGSICTAAGTILSGIAGCLGSRDDEARALVVPTGEVGAVATGETARARSVELHHGATLELEEGASLALVSREAA